MKTIILSCLHRTLRKLLHDNTAGNQGRADSFSRDDLSLLQAAFKKTDVDPVDIDRNQSTSSDSFSPVLDWYEEEIADIGIDKALKLEKFFYVPFVYNHYFVVNNQEDEYFGYGGQYTEELLAQHAMALEFWRASDPTGNFLTRNIDLLGVHGNVFQDKAKLVPTLQLMFGLTAYEADVLAEDIQYLIITIPYQYENPILTPDAVCWQSSYVEGPIYLLLKDAILLGDGLLEIADELDLGIEAIAYLHGHEFAHHVQLELAGPLRGTAQVPVTVVIQLDSKPTETGWMLKHSENGRTYAYHPPGTYETPWHLVTENVYVDPGDCEFTICASSRNGLEGGGHYVVYLGSDTTSTENVVLYGSGNFGAGKTHQFRSASEEESQSRQELMADAFSAYFLAHERGKNYSSKRMSKVHHAAFMGGSCIEDAPRGTGAQKRCATTWAASHAVNDGSCIAHPSTLRARFDKDFAKILNA